MHCVPPSKRHALCNANGRSGGASQRRRAASRQLLCASLHPASNNPVTNRRANASFLDMPRAHTRIRISTPHVGVLITFIGACTPPFRHRKRTATKQRLSAVRRSKPQRDPGIATSGAAPNSAQRQPHRLGSKPRQPQQDARHDRAHTAVPTAAGARRSASRSGPNSSPQRSRDRPNGAPPREQANVHNRPLKEGSE